MDEQNKSAKRRERIKTILIIFLALMLVLTFFSNTILNYSLPTVTAQYASYGTISEKVRGSGIVTANQNYEVIAEGNRTVKSVSIKQGDNVKKGDTLFVLEAAESDESVKLLEQEIEDLELNYQKALLTLAPDYEMENQEIANARQGLQDAIKRLNEAKGKANGAVSDAAYKKASSDAQKAQERISELSGYQSVIQSGETSGVPAGYTAAVKNAKSAYDAAAAALTEANAVLEQKQAALTVTSAMQQETILALERAAETAETAYQRAKSDYEAEGGTDLLRAMEDAQQAARYAQEDVNAAKAELTAIQHKESEIASAQTAADNAEKAATAAQNELNTAIENAAAAIQRDIDAAKKQADDANDIMNSYDGQSSGMDISTLEDAVKMQEQQLQTLILTLAETKKTDELTEQQTALDLQSQQTAIERKKEELAELKKNSGTITVTSLNAGVVSSVAYAAGDEVMDGSVLAVITLTDAGYTVQFSVSAEQARKVTVGTAADVTDGSWGSNKTATLVSSKADVENPTSTDRILTFDVAGRDITAGQMLSLSISCSSQSYDCVVPKSAIMEDSEGKFVLVMRSKSTPLGNRFYVARANISILASDEINCAVQGDVNYSDFIITASEKPLKPGDQVRQED